MALWKDRKFCLVCKVAIRNRLWNAEFTKALRIGSVAA
nr:MAG TPA: hypothetical protein [Caudoviricetes sp.]